MQAPQKKRQTTTGPTPPGAHNLSWPKLICTLGICICISVCLSVLASTQLGAMVPQAGMSGAALACMNKVSS